MSLMRFVVLFLYLVLLGGLFEGQLYAANLSNDKPNFLWIVSEDNSYFFSRLYNKQGAEMPNVEALAKDGLIFNNAFSNAPVCSTARSTLATGVYASKIALNYHRRYTESELPEGVRPIAQLLKAEGYYTSNNVKNDFNFVEHKNDPVWDASSNTASWKARANKQPFFHMQTYTTTHEYNLHFPATDVTRKPTKHKPDAIKLPPIYPDTALFRYTFARYLDQHQVLDKKIGKLIKQLKADGELENTFIFYFGDHGGVLPGTKGYVNDLGLHIPLVVRVPENYRHLLHPSMQKLKNTKIDGFINFVDFAPTLLKLANAKANPYHDGKAFLGFDVSLQQLNQRDDSFAYADRFDEKIDMVRTLRKGNLKYVRNYMPYIPNALFNQYRYRQAAYQQWKDLFQQQKLNAVQSAFFKAKPAEALYDISVDPFETHNLAQDPNYKSQLIALRKRLNNQLKSMPDLAFFPESHLAQYAFKSPHKFGEQNISEIAQLIDIANLQLLGWSQAKPQLIKALNSNAQWQQYWALIGFTYFAQQAGDQVDQISNLLAHPNPVIAARAVEFLTLATDYNPSIVIPQLIERTNDTLSALEIMNIATVLYDLEGYTFDITTKPAWREATKSDTNQHLQRVTHYWTSSRIKYLKPSLGN